jgi:hypothetical protein
VETENNALRLLSGRVVTVCPNTCAGGRTLEQLRDSNDAGEKNFYQEILRTYDDSFAVAQAAIVYAADLKRANLSFGPEADLARSKTLLGIIKDRATAGNPASPDLVEFLSLASEFGLSPADLRAAASLPGAQISNNLLPQIRTFLQYSSKSPAARFGLAIGLVGTIAYVKLNPLAPPTPFLPTPPATPPLTEEITGSGLNPTPPNNPNDPEWIKVAAVAAATVTIASLINPDGTKFTEADRNRRFQVGLENGVPVYQDAGSAIRYTLDSAGQRMSLDSRSPLSVGNTTVTYRTTTTLSEGLLSGGTYLNAPDVVIPYGYPIDAQGAAFEAAVARTGLYGDFRGNSSATFDFFVQSSGLATSLKTLNTLTDPRLAKPQVLGSVALKAIDAAIHYVGRGQTYTSDIDARLIFSKQVIFAVPAGTTRLQMAALHRAVDQGRLNNITVKIIITGR